MENSLVLMKALKRANDKAQHEFARAILRYQCDVNNFKLDLVGKYRDTIRVEFDGNFVEPAEAE